MVNDLIGTAIAEAILNAAWQGILLAAAAECIDRLLGGRWVRTILTLWGLVMVSSVALPILHLIAAVFAGGDAAPTAPLPAPVSEIGPEQASITMGAGVAEWVTAGVFVVVVLGCIRALSVFRSLPRLRALKAGARELPAPLRDVLDPLVERYGKRGVRLGISDEVYSPCTLGYRRPVVLLPASLVGALGEEDWRRVVLHELAHVRRGDDLARLAQRLLERGLFYLPAVTWAARRLDLAREIACDAFVVAVGGSSRSYAASLTRLATAARAARQPLALAAVSGSGQLARRVRLLLSTAAGSTGSRFAPLAVPLPAAIAAIAIGFGPEIALEGATAAQYLATRIEPVRAVIHAPAPAGAATPAAEPIAVASEEDPRALAALTSGAQQLASETEPAAGEVVPVPSLALACADCTALPRTEPVTIPRAARREWSGQRAPVVPSGEGWKGSRPPLQVSISGGPTLRSVGRRVELALPGAGNAGQLRPGWMRARWGAVVGW